MAFGFGPQQMGYDRAITVFSPEGKLYQVEYAFEAVKRGWSTIGMKCKEGVLIAVERKKLQNLIDLKHLEKIFVVDDHIMTSFAGLAADGRILVDIAREVALRHRFLYDEPPTVEYVAKVISDVKQAYTQHAGVRPFGVALIFAGVDEFGPQVFMTEPSGQYMSYYAAVIGQNQSQISEYLEGRYNYDMSLDDAIVLALKALMSVGAEEVSPENYEIGIVRADERKVRKLTEEEVAKYLERAKA
ncbi:proteasome subunit alpha [Ignicoccus pacificus DSM 13166]|uniref:Proteasome subunit alpha n=1 Tax=Ignicoccus pacificus DSM 13166 TaxID=940294 RepID=A0A977PJR4_9CREN|nr:proteasome subunit alpha [Ignicoccus pacificus DSM 13166]